MDRTCEEDRSTLPIGGFDRDPILVTIVRGQGHIIRSLALYKGYRIAREKNNPRDGDISAVAFHQREVATGWPG